MCTYIYMHGIYDNYSLEKCELRRGFLVVAVDKHIYEDIMTIFGGRRQSSSIFSNVFYYYFIPTTYFGPYGLSSGGIYTSSLRLTAPPKIEETDATGCNHQNKDIMFMICICPLYRIRWEYDCINIAIDANAVHYVESLYYRIIQEQLGRNSQQHFYKHKIAISQRLGTERWWWSATPQTTNRRGNIKEFQQWCSTWPCNELRRARTPISRQQVHSFSREGLPSRFVLGRH
jgi:hypothetical protein